SLLIFRAVGTSAGIFLVVAITSNGNPYEKHTQYKFDLLFYRSSMLDGNVLASTGGCLSQSLRMAHQIRPGWNPPRGHRGLIRWITPFCQWHSPGPACRGGLQQLFNRDLLQPLRAHNQAV